MWRVAELEWAESTKLSGGQQQKQEKQLQKQTKRKLTCSRGICSKLRHEIKKIKQLSECSNWSCLKNNT